MRARCCGRLRWHAPGSPPRRSVKFCSALGTAPRHMVQVLNQHMYTVHFCLHDEHTWLEEESTAHCPGWQNSHMDTWPAPGPPPPGTSSNESLGQTNLENVLIKVSRWSTACLHLVQLGLLVRETATTVHRWPNKPADYLTTWSHNTNLHLSSSSLSSKNLPRAVGRGCDGAGGRRSHFLCEVSWKHSPISQFVWQGCPRRT